MPDAQPYQQSPSVASSSSGPWLFDVWERSIDAYLKRPIRRAVVFAAHTAAMHPGATILLTVLVSITLAIAGLLTNFELETDGDILWTPTASLPVLHGEWVDNKSGFPKPTRNFRFVIHSNGDNLLTLTGARCLFDVVETIRATKGYTETCTKSSSSGGEESSLSSSECPLTAASELFHHNRTFFLNQIGGEQNDEGVQRAMSALEYPDGRPVVRTFIFGYPQPELPTTATPTTDTSNWNEDDVLLQYAASYLGDMPLSPEEAVSQDFELAATETVYQLNDRWATENVQCVVEVNTARSFDDELERGIAKDAPYMAVAFLIMGCFCALYLSKRSDLVKSQSIVGLGAVATIIASIFTGYGLLFCSGVPFSSITQIFPYIMVGIGLDDTFIIVGALSRTDPGIDVVERIVKVMDEVGVSITVSTLTTVVAFFLGGVSSLPGIRWFCWYAAPTVAIDFVYQITFFIAVLVYDDRRIKASRYDCLVCVKSKRALADAASAEASEDVNRPEQLPGASCDAETSFTRKLMSQYSRLLLQPVSKVIALLIFALMLGLGVWGASQQSQKMDFRDLTPTDSFIRTYFDAVYTYSSPQSTGFLRASVYFRDVNVSLPEIQDQMEKFVNDLVGIPFISSQPEFFWLRDFKLFVNSSNYSSNTEVFNKQLDIFLNLKPYSDLYARDVVRDENGDVTASRCDVVFDQSSLFDVKVQIDSIKAQRAVSKAQPINQGKLKWPFFSFGIIYYSWELYAVIVDEILLNVILGLVSVFCISLIFVPHPVGVFLLTPVVAAIYCELMAILYLADIAINGVSAVGLVMSIGLVVDYNFHIVLTYYETKDAASRNDRVEKVLTTMGTSILLGGFTTLLGVLPLSFTGSEVFRTFFFTFLGISGLSSLHGIVFVPVVLSLVGPHKVLLRHVERTTPQKKKGGLTPDEKSWLSERLRPIERVEL